jgi:hypothetical protein
LFALGDGSLVWAASEFLVRLADGDAFADGEFAGALRLSNSAFGRRPLYYPDISPESRFLIP